MFKNVFRSLRYRNYRLFFSGQSILCTIAGALTFLRKLPELRKIVRPVYVRMGIIPAVAEGMQKSEEVAGPGM